MKNSLSRLTFSIPGLLSKLEAGIAEELLGALPGVRRIHVQEAQHTCKVECDESIISAQEFANRLGEESRRPGEPAKDSPALVLKVPRLKTKPTEAVVRAVLSSLPGVAGITIRTDSQQIEVAFHSEGSLTTEKILCELHREGIIAAL